MIRKCTAIASIIMLMMAASTGCGAQNGEEQAPPAAENTSSETEQTPDDSSTSPETEQMPGDSSTSPEKEQIPDDSSASSVQTPSQENDVNTPDIIIIGGKVRSVSQDSFVISRVLMEDSDDGHGSVVLMPDSGSPEEELVTVRCTDETVFEHWTIQGGGAGIETREASFSEIQEEGGLEAEGYFDGEEFVAEKVIIEVYN